MIVYSLTNKHNPQIPFYIGITNNITRRLKQHQQNYQHHQPYIQNKEDIIIHPLINTGNNQYSKTLAEKIETNLIHYYHTIEHGSNKIADASSYFKDIWKPGNRNTTLNKLFNNETKQKREKTREKRLHKKFNKLLKQIQDDPAYYTLNEVIQNSDFKNKAQLNRYTKKYYNKTCQDWFENYKQKWYTQHNLDYNKRYPIQ